MQVISRAAAALVRLSTVLLVPLSVGYAARLPPEAAALIDKTTGGKGTYLPDEGVYKVVFPRPEAVPKLNRSEEVSPNLGYNSWAAFGSAVHHSAMLRGELLLLDDEVNAVLGAVMEGGLEVSGLAGSQAFDGTYVHTLDVTGYGQITDLAAAFRKGRDAIARVRAQRPHPAGKSTLPNMPQSSAIDGGPLDAVLSMRGTVVRGVYRAAIGRRALLGNEAIGREMGVSTWLSIAGSNDYAVAQGEFVCSPDDLQKVLHALVAKSIDIVSIRNHTIGEHPQLIYVRFRGHGRALDVAQRIRHVLEVQVGGTAQGSGNRI